MIQPELGMKVVELRLHKGMTQEQLAEAASVNVRTIQRIEKGETEPEAFSITNLSNVLEYDLRKEGFHNFWILAMHLSSILCIVIIPLLIWSCKKDRNTLADKHGRAVLNFQLTMTILLIGTGLMLLSIPLIIGVFHEGEFFLTAGVVLVVLLIFLGCICFYQGIANTIKVLNNKPYHYFLSIPFLK